MTARQETMVWWLAFAGLNLLMATGQIINMGSAVASGICVALAGVCFLRRDK